MALIKEGIDHHRQTTVALMIDFKLAGSETFVHDFKFPFHPIWNSIETATSYSWRPNTEGSMMGLKLGHHSRCRQSILSIYLLPPVTHAAYPRLLLTFLCDPSVELLRFLFVLSFISCFHPFPLLHLVHYFFMVSDFGIGNYFWCMFSFQPHEVCCPSMPENKVYPSRHPPSSPKEALQSTPGFLASVLCMTNWWTGAFIQSLTYFW